MSTDDSNQAYFDEFDHAEATEIISDVAMYRTLVSNVYMIDNPSNRSWILIDTGIFSYHNRIIAAAKKRFQDLPPKAIILTHGHFDHAGSAKALAKYWDVQIFVHENEVPYLNGTKSYPPVDPTVGGGMLSLLSPLFPRKPINLSNWLQPITTDFIESVLPGWTIIETPGHTPGHISLFRKKDRTLIAGDVVTTENPESVLSIFFPLSKVYGPPAFFTADWDLAKTSVKAISELHPNVLLAGHGLPMKDENVKDGLQYLLEHFEEIAIPGHHPSSKILNPKKLNE